MYHDHTHTHTHTRLVVILPLPHTTLAHTQITLIKLRGMYIGEQSIPPLVLYDYI